MGHDFALAVLLDMATRGTMMAAMMPRIVTTASNSMSENAVRLRLQNRVISQVSVLYAVASALTVMTRTIEWESEFGCDKSVR